MRRLTYWGLAATCALLTACGGSSDGLFEGTGGTAGTTSTGGASGSTGSGGSAGSPGTGGSAGAGTGGSAGAGTGGSAGAGTGGAAGSAGAGGAPACPGTARGCVIDWAGSFAQQGTRDGTGTAARFEALGGITGDGTFIWVADNNGVRRINIRTAVVTTVAGQLGNQGFANGQGTAAQFGFVDGIATDGTTVWVVDGGNNLIRAVDSSGNVTTLAGSQGQGGVVDGTGAAARFESARGMDYDGTSIFVAEAGNSSVIRRINPSIGAVDTIAGNNGQGTTNGGGDVAQFNRPRNLGSANGSLWVGDTENNLIREIVLGGGGAATHTVTTALGSTPGHMDGTGTNTQFDRLRGIDFDGTALVVADSDNFVIRAIDLPALTVTTIAGSPGMSSHAVGIGPAARFNKPLDVHFDPTTGDLFIVEGSVIRRMFYK